MPLRPDPPTNVSATDGEPTITITWDAVVGANSYRIHRFPAVDGIAVLIGHTDETMWIDTTAQINRIYWYGVTCNVDGCSIMSALDSGYSFPMPVDVPDSPVGLVAVVV